MNRFQKHFSTFILFCWLVDPAVQAASHHPQQFLDKIRGSKDEGEQIVQQFCANCHSIKPMIELGAPKINQEEDWTTRVKAGLDILFQHTDAGYGAMPARGGCFECTDLQLKLAIIAMLPKSIQKEYKKNKF